MKPHLATLSLIQTITEDGRITEEEVLELGSHLNDDKEARNTWPGNVLFEVLKRVFDDGKVDAAELKALGFILRGVELQCMGTFGAQEKEVEDSIPEAIATEELQVELPAIEHATVIKYPDNSVPEHPMSLLSQECGCGDWQQRRSGMPTGSPGRFCKHMTFAYLDPDFVTYSDGLPWQQMVTDVLRFLMAKDRAPDPFPLWEYIKSEPREWLICTGKGEWSIVFTLNKKDRLERYAYNLHEQRWAYGRRPEGSRMLAKYFRAKAGNQPANVPGRKRR